MDTADCFACDKQVLDLRTGLFVDQDTAVLVMQCRVDEDWFFAQVNAELRVHAQHAWQSLLDRACAVEYFDHWCIEPDGAAAKCCYAFATR